MSPVADTCVPPHSSTLKPGTLTTRTLSPCFRRREPWRQKRWLLCRTHVRCDRRVPDDLLVDDALDAIEFVAGDRLEVHEVESRAIGSDERAGLLDVRAQHLAKRGVQQMRGRMVAARRIARVLIHIRPNDVADAQLTGLDADTMRTRQPWRMRAMPSTSAAAPLWSFTMRPESET